MTASNLAIVFAPTLMKTSQENLGMDAVGETKHHARVIELLIAYVNYIFGLVMKSLLVKIVKTLLQYKMV